MKDYPKTLWASVLLLDGKIEGWKVVDYPKNLGNFKALWKRDRLNDYTVENKSWEVKTVAENQKVFNELAAEWFRQWPHAEDYVGFPAYGDKP